AAGGGGGRAADDLDPHGAGVAADPPRQGGVGPAARPGMGAAADPGDRRGCGPPDHRGGGGGGLRGRPVVRDRPQPVALAQRRHLHPLRAPAARRVGAGGIRDPAGRQRLGPGRSPAQRPLRPVRPRPPGAGDQPCAPSRRWGRRRSPQGGRRMSHAYFQRDGALLVPDKTARSPWSRDHQSGLAIAGHLALALEAAPAAQPMRIARLSVDFLGAVLMKPTESRVRILRDGKRMQILEASLWVDGAMAATATALRLSHGEGPCVASPPLPYPGPEDAPRKPVTPYFDAGHPLETRVISRATPEGGQGVFWSRFNTSFVAGEPT